MNASTRWLSGIGMSCIDRVGLDRPASTSGLAGGGASVADIASSSSIDAGSYFFSVNPSPSASAFTS